MESNTQQGKPSRSFRRAKRVSQQAVRFSLPFAICLGLLALAGTVSCHYLERLSLAELFLSLVTIVLSSSITRTATDTVVQSLQENDQEVFAAVVHSLLGNAAETCFVVIAVISGNLDIAKTALCGFLLANSLLTFSGIEAHLSVISCCLPKLRPVLRKMGKWWSLKALPSTGGSDQPSIQLFKWPKSRNRQPGDSTWYLHTTLHSNLVDERIYCQGESIATVTTGNTARNDGNISAEEFTASS